MKNTLARHLPPFVGALFLAAGLSAARADVVYENTNTFPAIRFSANPLTLQYGNEINLAGSARYVTNFRFEYWGTSTGPNTNLFAGNVEIQLSFYENTGTPLVSGYPYPLPLLWQSSWFGINPTPRDTIEYSTDLGDFVPTGLNLSGVNTMTWTVQFRNLGTGDEVGLDIASGGPTVGSRPAESLIPYVTDYWIDDGGWKLRTNNVSGSSDFGAIMQASGTPVPEPSSLAFGLLGGTGLLLALRRRNRRA